MSLAPRTCLNCGSLRARLSTAQARIAELLQEIERLREALLRLPELERLRELIDPVLGSNFAMQSAQRAVDLAAAQARIAELEAALRCLLAEAIKAMPAAYSPTLKQAQDAARAVLEKKL